MYCLWVQAYDLIVIDRFYDYQIICNTERGARLSSFKVDRAQKIRFTTNETIRQASSR